MPKRRLSFGRGASKAFFYAQNQDKLRYISLGESSNVPFWLMILGLANVILARRLPLYCESYSAMWLIVVAFKPTHNNVLLILIVVLFSVHDV